MIVACGKSTPMVPYLSGVYLYIEKTRCRKISVELFFGWGYEKENMKSRETCKKKGKQERLKGN
jgi:hypothetical protein